MATLLNLSDSILALETAINDCPDDDPEARDNLIAAYLEAVGDTRTKLDGYAALITELEARSTARKTESDRLANRAKQDETQAKFLRERLTDHFRLHKLETVETARYRLTLTMNGGQLPVVISVKAEDLPSEYLRQTTKVQPDVDAIRKALESGAAIEGAALGERGSSVRIR